MKRLFSAAGETAATPQGVTGVQSLRIPRSSHHQLKEATMKGWMSRVRPSTHVSMIVFAALALTIGALLFGGGATARRTSRRSSGGSALLRAVPELGEQPTRTTRRHRHDQRQWHRSSSNSHGRRQWGRDRPDHHRSGRRLHGRHRQYFRPGLRGDRDRLLSRGPARSTASRSIRAGRRTRLRPSRSAAGEQRRRQRPTRSARSMLWRSRPREVVTRSRRS